MADYVWLYTYFLDSTRSDIFRFTALFRSRMYFTVSGHVEIAKNDNNDAHALFAF